MRIWTCLTATLLLAGCVSAQAPRPGGTIVQPPQRADPFCDNYARQTYFNVFEDLYDSRDSFGATSFARDRALRAADRAYERCLTGRLN